MCPPYDVISEPQRRALVAADEHNFVRIILPEDGSGRFRRAAALLREWQERGVLVREAEPALYVYRQSFRRKGEQSPRWRRGILCAVRLTPFGEDVLPHERTMPKPKRERLELLRACDAQLGPIFMLYSFLPETNLCAASISNPSLSSMFTRYPRQKLCGSSGGSPPRSAISSSRLFSAVSYRW